MSNEEFIRQNRTADVRQLALKRGPEGVDVPWCLQQIEGWQLARKKLPKWAETDDLLWFPPRLSMEQCSSEATAIYKRGMVERLLPEDLRSSMADLTGGFGIDFSYMAPLFRRSFYVERQEVLCEIARHNFPILGLSQAEVVCADCTRIARDGEMVESDNSRTFLSGLSLIFMDPARRDEAGRKTVAIEDCTPDVVRMQDDLLTNTRFLVIKLSPMLDITQALRALRRVREVHVVSVRGECKELLFVLEAGYEGDVSYHCVNLETGDAPMCCCEEERRMAPRLTQAGVAELQGYLFEPNTSVLKAGCQDRLCNMYGVGKLHPNSNLFLSSSPVPSFPGRQFRIEAVSDFSKKGLKSILSGVGQANLAVRNFPATVAELRKKLKLREGGDLYFFATTLHDGIHALIRCRK